MANIAKELVGAKYIELLSIITSDSAIPSLLLTGAHARQEKRLQRCGWVPAGRVGRRRRHLEGLRKYAEVAEAVEKC